MAHVMHAPLHQLGVRPFHEMLEIAKQGDLFGREGELQPTL